MRKKAIVLVSGGMDSCVTAAIANKDYDLIFLHANYHQRTEKRELKAFNDKKTQKQQTVLQKKESKVNETLKTAFRPEILIGKEIEGLERNKF